MSIQLVTSALQLGAARCLLRLAWPLIVGASLGLSTDCCHAATYDFGAIYTGDFIANLSGGRSAGERHLANVDLTLEVDLGDTGVLGEGTLFAYGLFNNSSTFSDELIGDLQVVSNIDAPGAWRVFELWYEVNGGSWTIKGGLYDLNSEFDVNETGSLFINSSHGIGAELGQTGHNGPSIFPVSAFAVRVAATRGPVTGRIAVLDGVPGDPDDPTSNRIDLGGSDGMLAIAEIATDIKSHRLWLGYWRYSSEFIRPYAATGVDTNDGWYVGIEGSIGHGELGWFMRFGRANERINPVKDYLGLGLVLDSPVHGREADRLGLAIASATLGDPYRRASSTSALAAGRREVVAELTYRAAISEHLAVQPDIQYVRNPAASPGIADAWVAALRIELSW